MFSLFSMHPKFRVNWMSLILFINSYFEYNIKILLTSALRAMVKEH